MFAGTKKNLQKILVHKVIKLIIIILKKEFCSSKSEKVSYLKGEEEKVILVRIFTQKLNLLNLLFSAKSINFPCNITWRKVLII
jgi:hypothetical protein